MKIGDIIKNALVERRLISEDETGQSTRSYDLNNPEDVINASLANECWKQWGLTKKPIDSTTKKDYKISYRGQEKVIPAGTRFLYSDPFLFLGEKIQGESDKDNTYFYGFDSKNLTKNQFNGFRWKCSALRESDQSGTRNVTPIQQKLLDQFLSTYGSVYTQMGGNGKVAKDIRDLKYEDGRSIWDKNSGIPPEGNYVYVQETLYNIKPNQLATIAKNLDTKGWTIVEPSMDTPEYTSKRRMIDLFPDLKAYGLTDKVFIYPKDASKLSGVVSDKRFGANVKMNKETCIPAIQFLNKCNTSNGEAEGCKDPNKVNDNKYTVARCFISSRQNPTKKGLFGPEDELQKLYNSNQRFGIGREVAQLERNNLNESVDSVIKTHLLENIRRKNSQK
jgi:hypothetical protein